MSDKKLTDIKSDPIEEENHSSENPSPSKDKSSSKPQEIGGQKGPEPTRYGDWEKGGLISDF